MEKRIGKAVVGIVRVCLLSTIAIGVTSCGSSDKDSPPAGGGAAAETIPPQTATATSDGFIDYMRNLIGNRSDTSEASGLSATALPTNDAGEPTDI